MPTTIARSRAYSYQILTLFTEVWFYIVIIHLRSERHHRDSPPSMVIHHIEYIKSRKAFYQNIKS